MLPKQFAKFAQPPSRKRPSQTRITELHFQKRKRHCAKHWRMVSIQIIGVFCGKKWGHFSVRWLQNIIAAVAAVAAVASFLTYPVSCNVWLVGCDRSLRLQRSSAWPFSPMSNEEAMVEARHGPGTPQIHEFSNGWKSYTQATPRLRHFERGEQGNTLRLNRASLFDIWIAF